MTEPTPCTRCGATHAHGTDWPPIKVGACARCGEDHAAVAFKAFARPPLRDAPSEEPYATHWGTCPTTGEPIFSICAPTSNPKSHPTELAEKAS